MTRYCKQCGTKLDEMTYFCPVCDKDLLIRSRKHLGIAVSDEDLAENESLLGNDAEEAINNHYYQSGFDDERSQEDVIEPTEEVIEKDHRTKNFRKRTGVIIAAAFVLIACIGAIALHHPGKEDVVKDDVAAEKPIVDISNPSADKIKRDEETGELYFNDTLIVFTKNKLDDNEKKEIAASVGGSLFGALNGNSINLLQIKVEPTDRSKLQDIAAGLAEHNDNVLYASYDFPVIPKAFGCEMSSRTVDAANDEETVEGKAGTESTEETNRQAEDTVIGQNTGADWWDIINAGSAWNSSVDTGIVKVGLICEGIETENAAVRSVLPQLSSGSTGTEDSSADDSDAGTSGGSDIDTADNSAAEHAASIIAGRKISVNDPGNNDAPQSIQGIVSGAQLDVQSWQEKCSEINTQNRSSEGEATIERYFSSAQYVKMIQELIDENADVIDISFMDNMTWIDNERIVDEEIKQDPKVFDNNKDEIAEQRSKVLFYSMVSMLINNKDFLLIQPAGDDGENIGKGINKHGGLETVSESLFDELNEDGRLSDLGINSFDKIKHRMLTVGAIDTEKAGDYYLLNDSSNFGKAVDIAAPGKNVFTPISAIGSAGGKSCTGTVMAAAMTAGCAAFLRANNQDMNFYGIYDMLVDNSEDYAKARRLIKGFSKYPVLRLDLPENENTNDIGDRPDTSLNTQEQMTSDEPDENSGDADEADTHESIENQ